MFELKHQAHIKQMNDNNENIPKSKAREYPDIFLFFIGLFLCPFLSITIFFMGLGAIHKVRGLIAVPVFLSVIFLFFRPIRALGIGFLVALLVSIALLSIAFPHQVGP